MEPEDVVIVSGGDGTLHRFVNDTWGIRIPCEVLYYPSGTRNRFARARGWEPGCPPFSIKQELEQLPVITAGEKAIRFLHSVELGMGSGKPVRATVTVDGKSHTYKRVWLANALWDSEFFLKLYHNAGRLRAMLALPALRRGGQLRPGRTGAVLHGREIAVEWECPCPLVIDGEGVSPVSSCTLRMGGGLC